MKESPSYIFEVAGKVFQRPMVVVASYEDFSSIKSFENAKALARDDYITQVVDSVFFAYCFVPIFHKRLIHFFDRRKRSQGGSVRLNERQALGVSEMSIRNDKGAHWPILECAMVHYSTSKWQWLIPRFSTKLAHC